MDNFLFIIFIGFKKFDEEIKRQQSAQQKNYNFYFLCSVVKLFETIKWNKLQQPPVSTHAGYFVLY